MSENRSSWFQYSLWKVSACAIFLLLLSAHIGYGQTQPFDHKNVILQGCIHLQPVKPIPQDDTGKIQPGTAVKISVSIENRSQQVSPAGQLYVRYAFAPPLEGEKASVIFETEKKSLPSIEPGKKIEIAFDALHETPSLLDFVRYDWSIREYQAIAIINQHEYNVGNLAITFSAYYYPGIRKEIPTIIPSNPGVSAK